MATVARTIEDNRFTPGPYRVDFCVYITPKFDHALVHDMPIKTWEKPVYRRRWVDASFGCIVAKISFVPKKVGAARASAATAGRM